MSRRILFPFVASFLALGPAVAQETPRTELLKPSADETIHGRVDVCVRITLPPGEAAPTIVQAGIGSAYWITLQKAAAEGQWKGRLHSTMVPNGKQTLRVLANDRRLRASLAVTVENPLKPFWADLHSHTSYSDGTLTPDVAHRYARDEAKLDVFMLTDHLELIDEKEWFDAREVAADYNQNGRFVAIPGQEWTTNWGHMCIFDPKTRRWPTDPDKFYAALAAADVVAKFNHPGDGKRSHNGLAYSKIADKAIQAMEVRFDEEQKAYIRALDRGWHIAPDGSDDTHAPDWGNRGTWTVILAPGLSRACIWDAVRRRHQYSTHDRNCRLVFEVNGATMGDVIRRPVAKVDTLVRVDDPDANDAVAKIELFQDGKVVATDEPKNRSREWTTTQSPPPGKHYYFVKVVQADGQTMWSAPVWVEVRGK